jgi:hypothetical protein
VKILFVMLHAGFVRNYETALRELAARGHQVHIACETGRTKFNDEPLLQQVLASPGIAAGSAPVRAEGVREFLARSDRGAIRASQDEGAAATGDRWDSLATAVRLTLDYLRYFEPEYAHAPKLKTRAEKRLPRTFRRLADTVAWFGSGARRLTTALLLRIEAIVPVPVQIATFVREANPDVLLVTPLVEFGSDQVDYVKAARQLGIPTALCVASWDNLTNKGVMRVVPDRVIVWNEAQREEAATLHGVPRDRVSVTGAQIFDPWFTAQPTRSRAEFCRRVGLPADRPFILYVGSSSFIAPNEYQFAAAWIDAIRGASDPALAGAGILIRPHPTNTRRWWVLDRDALRDVAVWPPIGGEQTPAEFKADYFDSLYHCAAVVGVNTSAQIEAAILGRPVCTVRTAEFAHSQEGMPHFRHLLEAGGGLLVVADTLDEHLRQLEAALASSSDASARSHKFVAAFLRPHGVDRPATPMFVDAVEQTAASRSAATPASRPFTPVLVPLAWVARRLAEDRPVWILLLRGPLMATIRLWSAGVRAREWWHRRRELLIKRARRAQRSAVHESVQQVRRLQHRAVKQARRARQSLRGGRFWQ